MQTVLVFCSEGGVEEHDRNKLNRRRHRRRTDLLKRIVFGCLLSSNDGALHKQIDRVSLMPDVSFRQIITDRQHMALVGPINENESVAECQSVS